MKILKFKSLEKENIFGEDFKNMKKNNSIEFIGRIPISIVYAPNGTGKTSLAKILDKTRGTKCELNINGNSVEDLKEVFHVIHDQTDRNILLGDDEEYILSDSIVKEYEINKQIEELKNRGFNLIKEKLDKEFRINKKDSPNIELIENLKIKRYVESLANRSIQGKDISIEEVIKIFRSLNRVLLSDEENLRIQTLVEDSGGYIKNIIELKLENKIEMHKDIKKLDQGKQAIEIIERFCYMDECLICENKEIDYDKLRKKKESRNEKIKQGINNELEIKLLQIIEGIQEQKDVFEIKKICLKAIEEGKIEELEDLKDKINKAKRLLNQKIINIFLECLVTEELEKKVIELEKVKKEKLEIDSEIMGLVNSIVKEHINREIKAEKDLNGRIKLKMNGVSFIGSKTKKLKLSTGEENFISLIFEMIKARKKYGKIIVIDDPISSFDSIYKNKIVFCLLKILENREILILTHNTDLIKLINGQINAKYQLYIFNNGENSENGFILVKEKEMLIDVVKLIDFLKTCIANNLILDKKLFYMAMIPFMRGYANLVKDTMVYNELVKVMHGYENKKVNLEEMFDRLFDEKERLQAMAQEAIDKGYIKVEKSMTEVAATREYEHIYSVDDILEVNIEDLNDIISSEYQLLNKTLKHTLSYLWLRLKVEKELIEQYQISITSNMGIQEIVNKAFKKRDEENIKLKMFFLSRKTLINDFNHFEGNMNIFQPAIDISDDSLSIEIKAIIKKLSEKIK